jgi:GNAT superfamily N-acetyltransferase
MTTIVVEQPSEAEIDMICAALTTTYWSPGVSREIVGRAFRNSMCVVAREEGQLVGFARLVTDKATFAWLCDVFVAPSHRGFGVGRDLVRAFRNHPDLQNLRRWLLGTRDAHGVYAALGFGAIGAPERLMEIRNPAPYGVPV